MKHSKPVLAKVESTFAVEPGRRPANPTIEEVPASAEWLPPHVSFRCSCGGEVDTRNAVAIHWGAEGVKQAGCPCNRCDKTFTVEVRGAQL